MYFYTGGRTDAVASGASAYIYEYIYEYIDVYVYIHICIYICIYVCVCGGYVYSLMYPNTGGGNDVVAPGAGAGCIRLSGNGAAGGRSEGE